MKSMWLTILIAICAGLSALLTHDALTAHEIEKDALWEHNAWRERGRAFGEGLVLSLMQPQTGTGAHDGLGLSDEELTQAVRRLRDAWWDTVGDPVK